MDSGFGKFLLDNFELLLVPFTPMILYGFYKLKRIERRDNDLTPLIVKLKKHQESINKRNKSGSLLG